ncbi:hypothetical protein NMY22_g2445 [Coprinellus aureogranulatus]|nr:hypothetical protein NMY22_g2445 [Coprinellus aureogranulatus]
MRVVWPRDLGLCHLSVVPRRGLQVRWGSTREMGEETDGQSFHGIAARAEPSGVNQCNTGPIQCCQKVTTARDPVAGLIISLLGIVIKDLSTVVGLTCSPVSVIGVGANQCSAQPVCCQNNSFNGLIAIGCTPAMMRVTQHPSTGDSVTVTDRCYIPALYLPAYMLRSGQWTSNLLLFPGLDQPVSHPLRLRSEVPYFALLTHYWPVVSEQLTQNPAIDSYPTGYLKMPGLSDGYDKVLSVELQKLDICFLRQAVKVLSSLPLVSFLTGFVTIVVAPIPSKKKTMRTTTIFTLCLVFVVGASPPGGLDARRIAMRKVGVGAESKGRAEPSSVTQCGTNPVLCCEKVTTANDYVANMMITLLGAVVKDPSTVVGVKCVSAGATGSTCAVYRHPVCCQSNDYSGLLAVGCTPVSPEA